MAALTVTLSKKHQNGDHLRPLPPLSPLHTALSIRIPQAHVCDGLLGTTSALAESPLMSMQFGAWPPITSGWPVMIHEAFHMVERVALFHMSDQLCWCTRAARPLHVTQTEEKRLSGILGRLRGLCRPTGGTWKLYECLEDWPWPGLIDRSMGLQRKASVAFQKDNAWKSHKRVWLGRCLWLTSKAGSIAPCVSLGSQYGQQIKTTRRLSCWQFLLCFVDLVRKFQSSGCKMPFRIVQSKERSGWMRIPQPLSAKTQLAWLKSAKRS